MTCCFLIWETLTCRLGASLALKQCAEALAREADLADIYMLQALQQVVLALRTAEADPAGTGTGQQAAEAMQVTLFNDLCRRFVSSYLRIFRQLKKLHPAIQ